MSSMVIRKFHHIWISILESTRLARDRWYQIVIDGTEMSSTVFIGFTNHDTSNIPNLLNPNVILSLASQTKWDDMFSDPESDHIFSHFLGTYLVYILFLLLCGNYPLTLKRGRCRNLLSIDSRLNWIDPNTNIIFLPNVDRGYRTKFEILLGGVFQYSID